MFENCGNNTGIACDHKNDCPYYKFWLEHHPEESLENRMKEILPERK